MLASLTRLQDQHSIARIRCTAYDCRLEWEEGLPMASTGSRVLRLTRGGMRARRPLLALRIALLAAVLASSSVSSSVVAQTSEACPTRGGSLTFARSADVSNWAYQSNNPTIWAWPLVNLPLVRNNKDATGLDGAAAASWEISPDSKTFTFHLRDGLKFSNGSPLTSADVLDSFQAMVVDPQVAQGGAWPKSAFSAPDTSTFVVTLQDPQPAFIENQLTRSASIRRAPNSPTWPTSRSAVVRSS